MHLHVKWPVHQGIQGIASSATALISEVGLSMLSLHWLRGIYEDIIIRMTPLHVHAGHCLNPSKDF